MEQSWVLKRQEGDNPSILVRDNELGHLWFSNLQQLRFFAEQVLLATDVPDTGRPFSVDITLPR